MADNDKSSQTGKKPRKSHRKADAAKDNATTGKFTGSSIHIGGSVGKAIRRAAGTARDAGRVIRGKKTIADAVRDESKRVTEATKQGLEPVAKLERRLQTLSERIAKAVGGDRFEAFMQDIHGIGTGAGAAETALTAVDAFVQTGDLGKLHPLALVMSTHLRELYARISEVARPIPDDVWAALPPQVRTIGHGVRWITKRELVGNLDAPRWAFRYRDATAMTIFDIIVWEALPAPVNDVTLHTWAHEIFHVGQYKRAQSTESFIADYVANELGFKTGSDENPLEVQADIFACAFFPAGRPAYLPSNRCP